MCWFDCVFIIFGCMVDCVLVKGVVIEWVLYFFNWVDISGIILLIVFSDYWIELGLVLDVVVVLYFGNMGNK